MWDSWSAFFCRRQFPAFVTKTTGTMNWPLESTSLWKAFLAAGMGVLPRTKTPSMSNSKPKPGSYCLNRGRILDCRGPKGQFYSGKQMLTRTKDTYSCTPGVTIKVTPKKLFFFNWFNLILISLSTTFTVKSLNNLFLMPISLHHCTFTFIYYIIY